MLNKTKLVGLVALLIAVVAVQTATAGRFVVPVELSGMAAEGPEGKSAVSYYAAALEVPEALGGKEFLRAVLEMTVDVSAREVNGYRNEAPMLELYVLKGGGRLEADRLKAGTPSRARRNIPVGNARRVRMDITDVVKELMETPGEARELVVGSVSSSRDGTFTMKSSGESKARIIYYYTAK
jgi:hypothetical protein